MIELIIGFAIGLIVGWNFLPQPPAVKAIIEDIVDKVKQLIGK